MIKEWTFKNMPIINLKLTLAYMILIFLKIEVRSLFLSHFCYDSYNSMLVCVLTYMLTTKATRSNQYLTELKSVHYNEKKNPLMMIKTPSILC